MQFWILQKNLKLIRKNDRAYYDRGFAENKLAHYVSAIDDYTKAIELNPDVAEYFSTRGEIIYRTGGDLNSALEDLNKAIKLDEKRR